MSLTNNLLTSVRDETKTVLDGLFSHGAIGGGVPTSTALGSETLRKTVDNDTTTFTDKFISNLEILSTEANSTTISEAGFFDSNTGGNMLASEDLNDFNKVSDINVFIEDEITINVSQG